MKSKTSSSVAVTATTHTEEIAELKKQLESRKAAEGKLLLSLELIASLCTIAGDLEPERRPLIGRLGTVIRSIQAITSDTMFSHYF